MNLSKARVYCKILVYLEVFFIGDLVFECIHSSRWRSVAAFSDRRSDLWIGIKQTESHRLIGYRNIKFCSLPPCNNSLILSVASHKHQSVYSRINFTDSLASGAGNVKETKLMSQIGRVGEFLCE